MELIIQTNLHFVLISPHLKINSLYEILINIDLLLHKENREATYEWMVMYLGKDFCFVFYYKLVLFSR